jgi:hypothetical protein
MSTEPTTSRGVRLPDTLWEAIAAEAESLQMTPPEFIRRKLQGAVSSQVKPVQKTHATVQIEELADA